MLKMLSALAIPGGGKAFDDLTTTKMSKFNAETPDLSDVGSSSTLATTLLELD